MLRIDERGQGMVEYSLLTGLLMVIVLASLVVLGPQVYDMFEETSETGTYINGSVELSAVEGDTTA